MSGMRNLKGRVRLSGRTERIEGKDEGTETGKQFSFVEQRGIEAFNHCLDFDLISFP